VIITQVKKLPACYKESNEVQIRGVKEPVERNIIGRKEVGFGASPLLS